MKVEERRREARVKDVMGELSNEITKRKLRTNKHSGERVECYERGE